MTLAADILQELRPALQQDFRFTRTNGPWLQGGTCPSCGKKEVYARADNPRIIKCSRLDRCGWEESARERYPEIFDVWSKRHASTETEPNAAADAYLLHGRHLDLLGLRQAYSQEWFQDRALGIGSATVRFALPGGSWWERLIDQPGRFGKKARFPPGKTYRGQWWQRPDVDMAALAAADTIWLAEGIFNALAIEQAGQRAVSIMSAGNYPELALIELRKSIANGPAPHRAPKLVWALDLGRAGTESTRRFVDRARDEGWVCGAAQVRDDGEDGADLDWNDLLIRDKLGEAHRVDYLWAGDVLIAPSAVEKARLIYGRHRFASFHFVFRTRTFWASINVEAVAHREAEAIASATKKLETITDEERAAIRAEAERDGMTIEEIANVAFRALYRQRDEQTDETCYFFNIDFPSDRPSVKGGFTAAAVTTAAEFKKRLFALGTGAMWTGTQHQLDRIMQRQTPRIADVHPLGFTGYCRDTGAYVLGDIAVKDGRVYRPNDDDYFNLGKLAVKLGTSERLLDVKYDPDALDTAWLDDLWTAFGPKGLVVIAFWFGSFFAEQVRREQKSFPFLEMHGLPGTGKTTLVEFAWKLAGREHYEGFDPAKATPAAMARNLGKVGNLPVVLIEGDRRDDAAHARKFEWEELKTAYNGRSVRSRGVKNSGMETFEPPFRGAIVIEQNDPVNASRAILERIMSLGFDMAGWSPATKAAAQRIEQWPVEKVSGFIVHAIRREADVLARYRQEFAMHEADLMALPGMRTNRLSLTHGQLLAMLDAMRTVLPINDAQRDAAHALIHRMALDRQLTVEAEHADVALFWERFDFLEECEASAIEPGTVPMHPINHARDPKLISISLNEFEQRCAERRLSIPAHTDLIRNLKTSKARRFVSTGTVNSRSNRGTKHCWTFARPAAPAR